MNELMKADDDNTAGWESLSRLIDEEEEEEEKEEKIRDPERSIQSRSSIFFASSDLVESLHS